MTYPVAVTPKFSGWADFFNFDTPENSAKDLISHTDMMNAEEVDKVKRYAEEILKIVAQHTDEGGEDEEPKENLHSNAETQVRDRGGNAYAVSQDIYWRYDRPARGVKVFLLNRGGVAVTPGAWVEGQGLIGWHPLFKRDKAEEKRLGLL